MTFVCRLTGLIVVLSSLLVSTATAQIDVVRDVPCCDVDAEGVVWLGADPNLTFQELASYAAPVLWFSPDEPLLRGIKDPRDINIPTAFPFEETSDGPLVYYRVTDIVSRDATDGVVVDATDRSRSRLDLSRVTAISLDFFFYYPSEEGIGGHAHDVEMVEMKLAVYRQPECDECRYGILVGKVNAKAHGILWYDNTLDIDADARFPMHILVEEGKHASCTDKNGDGYFTPSYDVNRRINDAWGVRDVIASGSLFTGGYNASLSKVRQPEQRVFPPLPEDSRLRDRFTVDGVYAPDHAIYELRPWPKLEQGQVYAEESGDHHIVRFVDKGDDDWPDVQEKAGVFDVEDFLDAEGFAKSLSVSYRYDNHHGISFVFPLFILKSFNDPITGGWLMNRIYLKDKDLRDFGWQVLYTPSASRWVDTYFALGLEVDAGDNRDSVTRFMTEAGIKLRFNIAHSPVSFLKKLTDFWGFRFGIRYIGYEEFHTLGYALEIGAGSF